MGTIADKLQGVIDAKANLSAALISAGIDVPTDFREYGAAVLSAISSDIEYKYNMAGMIQAQNLTGSVTPENMRLTHVPDFVANEITIIRGYAFDGCRYLSVANFPNVLTAWGSAFNNCISLISANLSSCKSIEAGAFRSCSSMTDCYLPAVTSIQANAFANCTSLSSLNVDSCNRFSTPFGNTAVTEITLPNLTELHLPGSPRIDANTFGSVRKIRLGPISGATP